tara:strand:+ start:90 stop:2246 length:2157 start_codon:yes stop_codon:yes gene_type:complete
MFNFEDELAQQDAEETSRHEQFRDETVARIGAWRFQTIVCRHWLNNLCMNGDRCEYLHQYDADRMPECFNGINCTKNDCPFKHSAPRKARHCLFYKQGFCIHGPECKFDHEKLPPESRPHYGDFSTPFDGKDTEKPENKPMGELAFPDDPINPSLISSYQKGNPADGNGGGGGYKKDYGSGTGAVADKKEGFKKNINYRTTLCRMQMQEGHCRHGDGCHFAHSEELVRTREQNADDFDLHEQFFVNQKDRKPPSRQTSTVNASPIGGGGGGGGFNQGSMNSSSRFQQNNQNNQGSSSTMFSAMPQSKVWDQQGGRYKYFVVQIPADEDGDPQYDPIVVSVLKGVWCTSPARAEVLSNAFLTHDHVFLIFTCDGSGIFQGIARLSSEVEVTGIVQEQEVNQEEENKEEENKEEENKEEVVTEIPMEEEVIEKKNWAKLTVAKLKVELKARDLSIDGKKAVLVGRLDENDAATAATAATAAAAKAEVATTATVSTAAATDAAEVNADTATPKYGGFGTEDTSAIFTVEWLKLCELTHQACETISMGSDSGLFVPQAKDFDELLPTVGQQVLSLAWNEDDVDFDFEEIEIEPSSFEGWGNHGVSTLKVDGTYVTSLVRKLDRDRMLWKVEGPAFIVGCDGQMFDECFRRMLFGLPEEYMPQTSFVHPGMLNKKKKVLSLDLFCFTKTSMTNFFSLLFFSFFFFLLFFFVSSIIFRYHYIAV